MKTWIMVGGLAVGLVMVFYDFYKGREQVQSYSERSDDSFVHEPVEPSVRPRVKPPDKNDTCAVCLEYLVRLNTSVRYSIMALPCAHWFHTKCIRQVPRYSAKSNCPVCRRPFNSNHL